MVVVAVLERLQIAVGSERVRGRANATRAVRPYLASGHRSLQQVSERQNSIGLSRSLTTRPRGILGR